MSTPDEQALAALRRLDRPRQPDAAAHARIEAQMLDRFDRVAAGDAAEDLELHEADVVPRPANRRRVTSALLAAAAVTVLVVGLVVASTRPGEDASSTQSTVDAGDALVAEQLGAYCATYLPPVDEAAERFAAGLGSEESRASALIALEQATQGLVELPAPARERAGTGVDRVVEAASAARLAVALEIDEDREVVAALATLDEVIAGIDGIERVAACRRP